MDGLNPITRREVFLAAASGDQVETPEPITREEMYLNKIAEGGGGSDLPDTPAEDGTYALQNIVESGTGTLSWSSGGGGGGALVVNLTIDNSKNATADKTAAEIWAAAQSGVVVFTGSTAYLGFEGTFMRPLVDISHSDDGYGLTLGGSAFDLLIADTGSDYPAGTLI